MKYKNKILSLFAILLVATLFSTFASASDEYIYMNLQETKTINMNSYFSNFGTYYATASGGLIAYGGEGFTILSSGSQGLGVAVSSSQNWVTLNSYAKNDIFEFTFYNGLGQWKNFKVYVGQPPRLKYSISDLNLEWNDYGTRSFSFFFENVAFFGTQYSAIIGDSVTLFQGDGTSWISPTADIYLTSAGQIQVESGTQNGKIKVIARAHNQYGITTETFYVDIYDEAPIVEDPVVTSVSAIDVTENSAKIRGTLDIGDTASGNVWFEWREQGGSWFSTTQTAVSSSQSFFHSLTDLNDETIHEFRAKFTYGATTISGSILTFETLAIDEEPSDIWINTTKSSQATTGTKTAGITDLETETLYEFRACVEFNGEFVCGSTLEFETLSSTITTPQQVADLDNLVIEFNKQGSIDLTDYFVNQDNDEFIILIDGETWINGSGTEAISYNGGTGLTLTLTTAGVLQYTTGFFETEYLIEVRAINNDGEASDTFLFKIQEEVNLPNVIKQIPDVYLDYNQSWGIRLDEYFSNTYSILHPSYQNRFYVIHNNAVRIDYGQGISTINNLGDPSSTIILGETILMPDLLRIESKQAPDNYTIQVFACNDEGCISKVVNVQIAQGIVAPETPAEGVFGSLINGFLNLFPSPSSLSSMQKMAFVSLSLIILTILLFAIAHSQTGGIPTSVLYITLFLDAILFMFFAVIGYVPAGILIFLALGLIGLAYLKFRGGSGSTT